MLLPDKHYLYASDAVTDGHPNKLCANAAFGGAVSCSVTHSGTTSVDIVNSQTQLEPAKYTSFISVDKNTISAEGSGALFTGEMTIFQCFRCYFVQGWFKCGGVEICMTRFAMGMTQFARNRYFLKSQLD